MRRTSLLALLALGAPLDIVGTLVALGHLTSSSLSERHLCILPIGSVFALSALAAALALLGFATSSRWPLLIVTAVPTSGAAWYLSHVIVGSAKLLFAAPFHATRGRWADVAIGEAAPPKVTARNNVTLRRPIVWIGMAPFFADAGSEIVVAVVVLTVALLGLYRTLVMAGRWNEAAPSL